MMSEVSNTCKCELMDVKRLVKELEAYLACRDWLNAHNISMIISHKVKLLTLHEKERILDKRI